MAKPFSAKLTRLFCIALSGFAGKCIFDFRVVYHLTTGGMEHRIASGLPPDRNPNLVPLSYSRLYST